MNADCFNADNLIAHRGWQQRYPENTLLAIHGAIAAGACHIEIDIQLSKDGVPILLHNRTLEHMTGLIAAAHDLTLSELQQLNAAESARFGDTFSGTQLCTLAAVVELIKQSPQVHLYVELKRVAIEHYGEATVVDSVLAAIEPIAAQCTLISFWLPALTLAKQRDFPRLAPVLIDWPQLQDVELIALSASMIFCDWEKIPTDLQLNTLAWPFALYEIDTIDAANYWLKRGARWIETFNIGKFLTTDAINHGQS
jgi:glycerophosphoryl diester phosphodiesterase